MKAIIENTFIRLFVCALMLTSVFTVLQVSNSSMLSSAKADLGCGGIAVCLGTEAGVAVGGGSGGNVGIGGGNTGGSGGGSGTSPVTVGPGGVAQAPQIPTLQNPKSSNEFAKAYRIRVTFNAGSPCTTKTINGFQVKSTGSIETERSDLIDWDNPQTGGATDNGAYTGQPIYSGWYHIKTTCVYPPPPQVVGTNMTCLISYNATVDRLAQSYSGAGRVRSTSGTLSSKAKIEAEGKPACIQNKRVGLNYNPPAGQPGWGQYTARSSIRQVTCNFATTTFDGRVDQIGKCGNPVVVPGTTSNMTIWCNGFSRALLVKDWTGSDCQNTSNARLNCVIPTAATYAGYTGNVQGLRDGNDKAVRWGTPRVTGTGASNATTSNWRSSTVINAGSTPRNKSGDNNKSSQVFASSIPFSSAMTPGQNLTQNLRFYTAGSAGSPFSMTRNYRFDATFNSMHTTIQSLDLKTGNVGVTNSVTRITARNNKCGPQTSPRIDVVRAIGDNVVTK